MYTSIKAQDGKFSYNIDCPICQGARTDCRRRVSDRGTEVYHCRSDISLPQVGNYYRGREDSLGFTQWYYNDPSVLGGKQRAATSQELFAYKLAVTRKLAEERKRETRSKLSEEERHEGYSLLMKLPEMTLRTNDLEYLTDKGLTVEAIRWFGFRSIPSKESISTKKQIERKDFKTFYLTKAILPPLPGFDSGGRAFSVGGSTKEGAIWIPVRDWDRRVVAFQIRLRGEVKGGRYRWGSGNCDTGQPRLAKYEEWPVQVIHPLKLRKGNTLNICEGSGVKPLMFSEQTGRPTLGIVGGNLMGSLGQLGDYIKRAREEYGVEKVLYAPDAGDIGNRQIREKIIKFFREDRGLGEVRFLWWGQGDKTDNDIDERTAEEIASTREIDLKEFEEICDRSELATGQADYATGIRGYRKVFDTVIADKSDLPAKILPPFIKQAIKISSTNLSVSDFISSGAHIDGVYPLNSGNRLDVHAEIMRNGKYVLDRSVTGLGKSYAYNRHLGTSGLPAAVKYFMIYPDAKNPPFGHEFWTLLPGANRGEVLNDRGKRQNAKGKGFECLVKPPNCTRMDAREHFYSSGLDVNPSDLLCKGSCDKYNICKIPPSERKEGVPSYPSAIGERQEALKHSQIICHPYSLPPTFKYESSVLIVDEVSQSMPTSREFTVKSRQFREVYGFFDRDLRDRLGPILDWLQDKSNEPRDRKHKHGYNMIEILASCPEFDLDELQQLQSDVVDFVAKKLELKAPEMRQDGISREDNPGLKGYERAMYGRLLQEESDRIAMEAISSCASGGWVAALLEILKGGKGDIRILRDNGIAITVPDDRVLRKIKQAGPGRVVFMDATMTKAELAAHLQVDPSEIVECAEPLPQAEDPEAEGELRIFQLTDFGFLPRQRSAILCRRVEQTIDEIKAAYGPDNVGVFDFNSNLNAAMTGRWFVDDRGDNSYEDKNVLILVGTPIRNIGAMLSEYNVLYEKRVGIEDPGFKAYMDEVTNATYRQAIGRTRFARRLAKGEDITIFILSNYSHFTFETTKIKSVEINEEAQGRSDRTTFMFNQAREHIQQEMNRKGGHLSYAELADAAGIGTSTVHDMFTSILQDVYVSPEDLAKIEMDMEMMSDKEIVEVEEIAEKLNDFFSNPERPVTSIEVDVSTVGWIARNIQPKSMAFLFSLLNPVSKEKLTIAMLCTFKPPDALEWLELLIAESEKRDARIAQRNRDWRPKVPKAAPT